MTVARLLMCCPGQVRLYQYLNFSIVGKGPVEFFYPSSKHTWQEEINQTKNAMNWCLPFTGDPASGLSGWMLRILLKRLLPRPPVAVQVENLKVDELLSDCTSKLAELGFEKIKDIAKLQNFAGNRAICRKNLGIQSLRMSFRKGLHFNTQYS